jgi:hypothetical protein
MMKAIVQNLRRNAALAASAAILLFGSAAIAQQSAPPSQRSAPQSAPPSVQQSFPTPEAAADALIAALRGNDRPALDRMFGAEWVQRLQASEPEERRENVARFLGEVAEFRAVRRDGEDTAILMVGFDASPFPVPLRRVDGAWRYDPAAGAEELLNRRIGANELTTIRVMRAYIRAQTRYASRDRVGDGVRQFATRIASTPGRRDGLYWDEAPGEEPSPVGALLAGAGESTRRAEGTPYHGYLFRILTRQGASAAGGAYDYVINGRMLAGFGLIAWPAVYGETGVMTFIVNHNGAVYERDLGARTPQQAAAIRAFDPGPGWRLLPE